MRLLSSEQLIDVRQVVQDADIELWEVDLSRMGGERYRFCNEVNELGQSVVWQGQTYQAYPCQGSGFEWSGKGPSNRPKLQLANLTGLVTGLIEEFDDLVGAVVTRRLVQVKYLDAVNFNAGNPLSDPTHELMVSRYIIERLVDLTAEVAAFDLALPSETDGLMLPARVATTNACSWLYRGPDCGYTGGPVADERDQPTADYSKDKCGGRLSSCRLRFGNGPLNIGIFPASNPLG